MSNPFSTREHPAPNRDVAAPTSFGSDDDGALLLRLANVLLRYRAQILLCAIATALVVIGARMVVRRTFTTTTSFSPQTRRPASNVSALALQLGLNVAAGEANASPSFYADLIQSSSILTDAARDRYPAGSSRAPALLADILDITGDTPGLREDRTIDWLRKHTEAEVSAKTGIVHLAVTTPSAELSAALSQRLLDLLAKFNIETRKSQASAERRFTEDRLTEARRELRVAEDAGRDFRERNRNFLNSPQLKLEDERLQREVDVRQQVYTTLSQAYEQARIEEVRDTPVLTIIDAPKTPNRPDSRHLIVFGVVSAIAGLVLGVAIALVRDLLSRSQSTWPSVFDEFVALRRDALTDLRHPLKAMRGRR